MTLKIKLIKAENYETVNIYSTQSNYRTDYVRKFASFANFAELFRKAGRQAGTAGGPPLPLGSVGA